MKSFTRTAAVLLLLAIGTEATGLASTGPNDAAYCGGTVTAFFRAGNRVEGRIDTTNDSVLTFGATDKPFAGQVLNIPYASITDITYGQKASRRLRVAVVFTILVGPLGLLALLSKKHAHYLTLSYQDADRASQVVVLEIGKGSIQTTLAFVEARTGKRITYQDNDVQRWEVR